MESQICAWTLKKLAFWGFISVIFACCQASTERECNALIDLFRATDGPHWVVSDGWDTKPTANCCGFHGVVCAHQGGSVVELTLSNNGLRGIIPDSFGHLESLERLTLDNNLLLDTIPDSICSLKNLTFLDLGHNNMNGSVPEAIAKMTSLQTLYLSYNRISGEIPSALFNLPHLKKLFFEHNQFAGNLPASIENAQNLEFFAIEDNQLEGSIPSSLTRLQRLWYLAFGGNNFSGHIPASIGDLSSLLYLYLDNNNLSGPIPPSIGNLTKIKYLNLGGNSISGVIPDEMANLSELLFLGLSDNQLTGAIPPLPRLVYLQVLNLGNNRLAGPVPVSLRELSQVEVLDLSNNSLSGIIPLSAEYMPSLRYVFLDHNHLSGGIPHELELKPNLRELHLNSNRLTGRVPSSVGDLRFLHLLDVSNNRLTGGIPSSINNLVELHTLDVSNNLLSGALFTHFAALPLAHLDFSRNKLTGTISATISNLRELQYLSIANNSITGEIPGLGDMRSLRHVDVSYNRLRGRVPAVADLESLQLLHLQGNDLTEFPPRNAPASLTSCNAQENPFVCPLPPLLPESLAAVCGAQCIPPSQGVYHVSTNGSDANNGTSSDFPFQTLQRALAGSGDNNTILVYAGVYESPQYSLRSDNFSGSLRGLSFVGLGGDVVIMQDSQQPIILADLAGRPMSISFANFFFVNNASRAGCLFNVSGSAVTMSFANCTFEAGRFVHNASTQAIRARDVSIALRRCTFRDFWSLSNSGGAVATSGGLLTVSESTVFSNNSAARGGALYANQTQMYIEESRFDCNSALGSEGGAVYIRGDLGLVAGSNFSSNQASTGGALFVTGSLLVVEDSHFVDNYASSSGGALFVNNIIGVVKKSSFVGNTAAGTSSSSGGGGVFVGQNFESLYTSDFVGNMALNGGAVFRRGVDSPGWPTNLIISGCTFRENTAGKAGGALNVNGTVQRIVRSSFVNNTALHAAGAIQAGNIGFLWDSEYIGNHALQQSGGALNIAVTLGICPSAHLNSSRSPVDNVTFVGNVAAGGGGAILASVICGLNGSVFRNNTAVHSVGGAVQLAEGAGYYNLRAGTYHSTSGMSYCHFHDNAGLEGGAVWSASYAIFHGVVFSGNRAVYGGAVSAAVGFYEYCIMEHNTAGIDGGAVDGQIGTFTSSRLAYNTAGWRGGAVTMDNGYFSDCVVQHCSSNYLGGGIYTHERFAMFNTSISSCYSIYGGCVFSFEFAFANKSHMADCGCAENGGAIYSSLFAIFVSSEAVRCSAQKRGGAVYVSLGEVVANHSNFEGNTALHGGALFAGNGLKVSNSSFKQNEARQLGGGICLFSANQSDTPKAFEGYFSQTLLFDYSPSYFVHDTFIEGCTFEDNWAHLGGGAVTARGIEYSPQGGEYGLRVWGCVFHSNRAWSTQEEASVGSSGGAVSVMSSLPLYLGNSSFHNNTAEACGNSLFSLDSSSEEWFVRESVFGYGSSLFSNQNCSGIITGHKSNSWENAGSLVTVEQNSSVGTRIFQQLPVMLRHGRPVEIDVNITDSIGHDLSVSELTSGVLTQLSDTRLNVNVDGGLCRYSSKAKSCPFNDGVYIEGPPGATVQLTATISVVRLETNSPLRLGLSQFDKTVANLTVVLPDCQKDYGLDIEKVDFDTWAQSSTTRDCVPCRRFYSFLIQQLKYKGVETPNGWVHFHWCRTNYFFWLYVVTCSILLLLIALALDDFKKQVHLKRVKHLDLAQMNISPIFESKCKLEEVVLKLPLLGRGGQGEVYRATWQGNEVAVKKIVFKGSGEEYKQNEALAEREVINHSKLHHPHILPLYSAGKSGNTLFIVMELAARRGLATVIRSRCELPYWLRIRLLLQIARALMYLHTRKPPMMHRDLKSGNVLITHDYKAKLGDFGLAKETVLKSQNDDLTVCGTVSWMAPEVLRRQTYSLAADIYSFGILMHEIWTREQPYPGIHDLQIFNAVVHYNMRPKQRCSCPKEYQTLMRQCWHEDPEQRPTIAAVIDKLLSLRRQIVGMQVPQDQSVSDMGSPVDSSFTGDDGALSVITEGNEASSDRHVASSKYGSMAHATKSSSSSGIGQLLAGFIRKKWRPDSQKAADPHELDHLLPKS